MSELPKYVLVRLSHDVGNPTEIKAEYEPNPDVAPVVRCKDCKYISATTLGMKYACWKGAYQVYGETGDHAGSYVCRRIDDPEFFCADGERRGE